MVKIVRLTYCKLQQLKNGNLFPDDMIILGIGAGRSEQTVQILAPSFFFFSCSTQLSMKFFLLINVKMLTFMSGKNSILGLSEPEKC